MIKKEDVYKIGRIGKAHGVKGEVTFTFDDDVFDRVDADFLILEVDGILVPFFMEEYRFRSDNTALVKFEDIDTQDRARELTNCDVYFLRSEADDEEEVLTYSFLVGFPLGGSCRRSRLMRGPSSFERSLTLSRSARLFRSAPPRRTTRRRRACRSGGSTRPRSRRRARS